MREGGDKIWDSEGGEGQRRRKVFYRQN